MQSTHFLSSLEIPNYRIIGYYLIEGTWLLMLWFWLDLPACMEEPVIHAISTYPVAEPPLDQEPARTVGNNAFMEPL